MGVYEVPISVCPSFLDIKFIAVSYSNIHIMLQVTTVYTITNEHHHQPLNITARK